MENSSITDRQSAMITKYPVWVDTYIYIIVSMDTYSIQTHYIYYKYIILVYMYNNINIYI